jgi:Zn finger protein HypA/HybF involved in hydrogenase expression
MSANIDLECLRCGIGFTMKPKAYEKRIERKQQNVRSCPDCYERSPHFDSNDFWLFVKNALRLTAN